MLLESGVGLAVARRRANLRFMPPENETSHARGADLRQVEIYRSMPPEQRMAVALRMRAGMRQLLTAGFRSRHPNWTDVQVSRAVADRILHARTD